MYIPTYYGGKSKRGYAINQKLIFCIQRSVTTTHYTVQRNSLKKKYGYLSHNSNSKKITSLFWEENLPMDLFTKLKHFRMCLKIASRCGNDKCTHTHCVYWQQNPLAHPPARACLRSGNYFPILATLYTRVW